MHIQAYRTTEDAIDGVVATFGDITAQKQVEQALRRSQALAEEVVETVRQPLVVLDADLRVKQANQAFYRTFRVKPEETINRLLYDLGNRQWDIPRLRELLDTIIPQDSTLEGYSVDHEFEDIGCRRMVLHARPIGATEWPAGPHPPGHRRGAKKSRRAKTMFFDEGDRLRDGQAARAGQEDMPSSDGLRRQAEAILKRSRNPTWRA